MSISLITDSRNLSTIVRFSASLPVDVRSGSLSSRFSTHQPGTPLFFYQQLPVLVLMTLIYSSILATSLTANTIMLAHYLLRRNINFITNPYILCLMAADMLWPLINVPMNLADIWSVHWTESVNEAEQVAENGFIYKFLVCELVPFLQVIFPDIIAITLCLIAVERYFTIIHPFTVNPMLKRPFACVAIALIIGVPLVVNLPFFGAYEVKLYADEKSLYASVAPLTNLTAELFCLGRGHAVMEPKDAITSTGFVDYPRYFVRTYRLFQSVVFVIIMPGVLFPFCYGRIIYKVTTISLDGPNETARRMTLERRKRMVTFIAVLAQLTHFTCWTPLILFHLMHFTCNFPPLNDNEATCLRILTLLAAANPALNSLLYKTVLRSRKRASSSSGGLQTSVDAAAAFTLALFTRPHPSISNSHLHANNSSTHCTATKECRSPERGSSIGVLFSPAAHNAEKVEYFRNSLGDGSLTQQRKSVESYAPTLELAVDNDLPNTSGCRIIVEAASAATLQIAPDETVPSNECFLTSSPMSTHSYVTAKDSSSYVTFEAARTAPTSPIGEESDFDLNSDNDQSIFTSRKRALHFYSSTSSLASIDKNQSSFPSPSQYEENNYCDIVNDGGCSSSRTSSISSTYSAGLFLKTKRPRRHLYLRRRSSSRRSSLVMTKNHHENSTNILPPLISPPSSCTADTPSRIRLHLIIDGANFASLEETPV